MLIASILITASLIALGLYLLFRSKEELKEDVEAQAPEEVKISSKDLDKKRKIQVIRETGGIIAKEFDKLKTITDTQLEVLYRAASQEDIRFDLATEKVLQVVPHPSNIMDFVQVEEVSQLPEVSPDQMVLDDDLFYRKFVMRDLLRPEYYEYVETFKRLYILLDVSPSMFEEGPRMPDGHMRDTWARGVVASLLVDAANGKAEYLLRPFSDTVHDIYSAKTPAEAEKLLSRIVAKTRKGSGTNIGHALSIAVRDIRKLESDDSRINHILLITDGDDQNGLQRNKVLEVLGNDIQLHAVVIGNTWSEMHPLAPYIVKQF